MGIGEGFRFYDLKRRKSALNRVGRTTVPANTSNHISSVALEVNIPVGDKRSQWLFPRAEINANLQWCKIQINILNV